MATDDFSLPTFYDDITGETRVLGTLAPSPEAIGRMMALPVAAPQLVPEAQWQEFELDLGHIKVKDQNGKGACNGFACASSLEVARRIAGMTHVDLSGWYVYAILCNGIDRGSMIEEALGLARERGVSPEPLVPYGTIAPRRIPENAHDEAKHYKIEVGSILRNFDEMMAATQLRRPFNFSICVGADNIRGQNFNNLDAEGVPGFSPGWGNHAVTGGLGAKRLKNGEWAIRWVNSWSTRWGMNGFAWVTRKFIDNQKHFSAYTIVAVADHPTDPLNPIRVPV